jgi:YHS domain-containing protein
MTKNIRLMAVLAVFALVLAVGVVAQQKSDTAVDPVCGMTVAKAKAAASFDYKGTTYYFCSTGCRDTFAKDPEKYAQAAQAQTPAQAGRMGPMGQMGQGRMSAMSPGQAAGQPGMICPMMPGNMGGRMGAPMGRRGRMGMMGGPRAGGRMGMPGPMGAPGMALLFRLYGDKIEVTVENTKDGAALKFTSKDPEVVKAIQVHLAEHLALMKKAKEAAAKPAAGGDGEK